ncbi:AAA domain-containing protein [Anaerocolumna sedimenticola]|uniref:AAA domain-containing protein n=1 Tax=Anaerocolumna sedimenticola TaxID=2696063 RepID=A0A6P1TL89_9FIRM|nr:MoxR family ATPase [Anaerocolumna sedimenticola]QHQ60781.1 AAA domain-containing protein [Anaerocolumna sedimenticola]
MDIYSENTQQIINEVGKVIIGKNHIISKVLTAILAKGHILIEDIPGVGKTTLALAFSRAMDLEHNRLQFTPDVLPTDVVGYHLLSKENGDDQFKPGPVMCNLFLADEINRTSPKSQSALLEVMEEGTVTVDGITKEIPKPFTVIATQNPIGSIGTQMLPESQLDRFMIKLTMGYPDIRSEVNMLKGRQSVNPLSNVNKVINKKEILAMQAKVEKIFIHDSIYDYIVNLILLTRKNPYIELGLSPRGTIALTNMAKANAFIHNRDYLIPDDVRAVFGDVTAHRILLKPKARLNDVTMDHLIDAILQQVQAPRVG